MKVPILKRAYRLNIINALKKKKPAEPLNVEYIQKSKRELTVTYAIAGLTIELTYYRYNGVIDIQEDQAAEIAKLYGVEGHNYIATIKDPLFVVSKLEGIIVGSTIDDEPGPLSYEHRVATQMASAAHVQLPSTFAIINAQPLYVIPSMEHKETSNQLIEIDNPLKFIEIVKIEGLILDLVKLRDEIKKAEPAWIAHSPFYKESGLTKRVRDIYSKD